MVLARYPNITPDSKMQFMQVSDVENPTSTFKYSDSRLVISKRGRNGHLSVSCSCHSYVVYWIGIWYFVDMNSQLYIRKVIHPTYHACFLSTAIV